MKNNREVVRNLQMSNNNKGSSMVELIMVMALLLMFGVTIYTLVYTGANTQERIMHEKDALTDARIALSYINVRMRQNDSKDKVAVETLELTGKNAIVIRERSWDYEYDTWIYCYDGKLMECLVQPGEQPTELSSFYIVDSEGLDTAINPDNGAITNTVYYYYHDVLTSISSTVSMRSH